MPHKMGRKGSGMSKAEYDRMTKAEKRKGSKRK